MRGSTVITVLRSIIAVLLVAIGVAALVSGHLLVGLLLVTFAALNVTRTVTMHKRRAELRARFPGLAERRAGRGGTGADRPFRQPPVPSA